MGLTLTQREKTWLMCVIFCLQILILFIVLICRVFPFVYYDINLILGKKKLFSPIWKEVIICEFQGVDDDVFCYDQIGLLIWTIAYKGWLWITVVEIVSWSRFLCICICLFMDRFGQGGLSMKSIITLFALHMI